MRVGILHLATLIDSVVRQADGNEGGGDGAGLVPAKSRVQQLKAKALSTAAAAAVAADSSACASAGEATGAGVAPVATTTLALEGDPFLHTRVITLGGRVLQKMWKPRLPFRLLFLSNASLERVASRSLLFWCLVVGAPIQAHFDATCGDCFHCHATTFRFPRGLLMLVYLCPRGIRSSLEQHRGGEDHVEIDHEADKPDGSGLVDTIPLDREEVQYTDTLVQ